MILHLRLRADGQLHSDVAALKNTNRVHDVGVVRGLQRNVGADLMSCDSGLPPVIEHIDLDRAVIVRSGRRVVTR